MASRKLQTGKDKLTKTPLKTPDRLARGKKKILTAETLFFLENNNVSSNAKPNTKKILENARETTCLPKHKTSLKPLTLKVNVRPSISSLSFAKATSTTNDVKWGRKPLHETTKELMRRNRERNKLRRFELEIKRLRGLQSDFMETCAELKDVNPSLITKKYKFIGVELNDKFQLLVNEDDLLRFPKNLPSETINDLKKSVKFCLHRCRDDVIDHLKVTQNSKEISDYIHERLPQLFNSQLDECMKQIDCLCKDRKNRKDSELTRTLRELQDSRRCCQKLESELDDIKKQNAEEKRLLTSNHKTTIENANKARENHEKKLNKQIWELKNQLTAQASTLKDSIVESKQRDIKPLHKDIIKLDSSSNQLFYELKTDKAENQLNSYKQCEEKYCETINSLEKQLEQAREQINKLQNFELEEKNQEINELQNVITHLKEEKKSLKGKDKLKINRKETYDKIEELKVQASNEEMSEPKSKSIPKSIILETLQNFEIEELKNKLLESEKEMEDLKEELTLIQKLLDERSQKLNKHIISKKENEEKIDFLTYKDIEKSTIIEQLNSKILFHKEQMSAFDFQFRDKEMKLIWQTEACEKLQARVERRNQEIKRLKELNKKTRNDAQDDASTKVVYKKKHYKTETE